MKTEKYIKTVQIPELIDFKDRFRTYAPYSQSAGSSLFAAVMTPESFISAEEATFLNRPAVAGIVRFVDRLLPPDGKGRDYAKQYVGALVCLSHGSKRLRKGPNKRQGQENSCGRTGVYSRPSLQEGLIRKHCDSRIGQCERGLVRSTIIGQLV